jgi:uncharacterized membrane protein YdbT with pleckstrin-like domain
MVEKRTSFWRSALDTITVYLMWAIVSVAALGCLLIARGAITSAFRLIVLNSWVVGAVDKFALFGLGIVGLVIVLFAEHYLSEASKKGTLYRSFAVFAGIEALTAAFFFVVQQVSFALLVQ